MPKTLANGDDDMEDEDDDDDSDSDDDEGDEASKTPNIQVILGLTLVLFIHISCL